MKSIIIVSTLALLVTCGCSSTKQVRGPLSSGVQQSGFLGDLYPRMQEGEKGQSLLFYRNPHVDTLTANSYDQIMLGDVVIYAGSKSSITNLPEDEVKNLANLFMADLGEQLNNDYKLVNEPGPKTLRIQAAITDAQATRTTLKAISFIPIPVGLPGVKIAILKSKELATGRPVFAGEVTVEIKISDAQSGEVLFAAVDRRVGTRLGGGWKSWTDADESFRYWAEKIRYKLCVQLRHGTDCVPPKE